MCRQIFGGDQRRGSHVDQFRNFEDFFFDGSLANHFRSRSWNSARGSLREFVISSDVKYWAHGALRSTGPTLSSFYLIRGFIYALLIPPLCTVGWLAKT